MLHSPLKTWPELYPHGGSSENLITTALCSSWSSVCVCKRGGRERERERMVLLSQVVFNLWFKLFSHLSLLSS